nr:response regulator transcription factor [Dissulfurirhabdus thermomarina]
MVDDHPLFREGLKALIRRSGRFEVAGEAGTGREALDLAAALRPDLVTLDLALPDANGHELIGGLRRAAPSARILVVSMHGRFEYIAAAFRAGAHGYIVKEATGERLIQALDALLAGEHFLDGAVSREVLGRLLEAPDRASRVRDDRYGLLSRREQEVMRLIVEGVPSREIAARLHIKPKTVENHRSNLMGKLGVHSQMELVRYAARIGLVDLDLWKEPGAG